MPLSRTVSTSGSVIARHLARGRADGPSGGRGKERELGERIDAGEQTLGVGRAYAPWLRRLLIDARDAHDTAPLASLGITAVVTDVMMTDRPRERALARRVLDVA